MKIAVVSDFPGVHFIGPKRMRVTEREWRGVLADALQEAGIRDANVTHLNVTDVEFRAGVFEALRRDTISEGISRLHEALRVLDVDVIFTLGSHASHAVIPEWPDGRSGRDLVHRGDIKRATDIPNRRGYVFDSIFGPVVASMHPAFIARNWSPWRVLLTSDLRKASEIARAGLQRPRRDVEIVGSDRDARRAVLALRRFRVLGADIETWSDTSLACVGFAGEDGPAFVFPTRYLDRARELFRDDRLTTVWANGIYDLFVLKHRYGVDFRCRVDDAQLAWHAAYPELAGAKEDKKKHRFTRKSLAFLASLSTTDAWWKSDYETEEEFFIYNGKDCHITLDVWNYVMKEVKSVGAEATYEHERRLMWPCVDMLERGLHVNEPLRQERVSKLESSLEDVNAEVAGVVLPFLEENLGRLEDLEVLHLFQETEPTCPCCRHSSKKQTSCWACAGFDKAPSKAAMVEKWGPELTSGKSKKELEEELLPVCHVCGGHERKTTLTFNLNSTAQMKTILYDLLRLPKKFNGGSLTVSEGALKSLLGGIPEEER